MSEPVRRQYTMSLTQIQDEQLTIENEIELECVWLGPVLVS